MTQAPLVLTFDVLERGEAARAALIAAGFAAQAVHVVAREDEAGPEQGNFTVGSGRPGTASESNYQANFGHVARRAEVTMTIAVDDEASRERALGIAQPFGAVDVARRAAIT
jgi:hypothetical protein